MIRVDVRDNLKSVIAEFGATAGTIRDKATIRALNRALDQTATATSREIRKEYKVTHRAVLRAIKKQRAFKGRYYAAIEMSGRKIPLIEFGARWTPATPVGASVQVKVKGGRKRVRGAFIGQHGATGTRQVFRRVGRERLPIMALRSISLPVAFINKTVIAAVRAVAAESFRRNFEQQIRFMGTSRG